MSIVGGNQINNNKGDVINDESWQPKKKTVYVVQCHDDSDGLMLSGVYKKKTDAKEALFNVVDEYYGASFNGDYCQREIDRCYASILKGESFIIDDTMIFSIEKTAIQ